MECKVLVFIINTEPSSTKDNINNLKNTFSNSFFKTKIIKISNSKNYNKSNNINYYDFVQNERIMKIFEYSLKNYPNLPCIIILDTSITYEPSDKMLEKIKSIIDLDICYLCKWSVDVDNHESKFKDVYKINKPNGFQAIFFSNKSMNLIFNDYDYNSNETFTTNINNIISKKLLDCYCFTPNIINYDINYAKKSEDYLKLNEFYHNKNKKLNKGIAYVWFIIIILLMFAVAWTVVKLGPNKCD